MKRSKGRDWIAIPTNVGPTNPRGQTVWLRLRWIVQIKEVIRDRLGVAQTTVYEGNIHYRPPGCDVQIIHIDSDTLNLMKELLNPNCIVRAA